MNIKEQIEQELVEQIREYGNTRKTYTKTFDLINPREKREFLNLKNDNFITIDETDYMWGIAVLDESETMIRYQINSTNYYVMIDGKKCFEGQTIQRQKYDYED